MTTQIELLKIFRKTYTEAEAEAIVTFISEQVKTERAELDRTYLTQKDKVEIIERIGRVENTLLSRMDSHFKWLTGIAFTLVSIAIALNKLL